jgi:hypothetical protein
VQRAGEIEVQMGRVHERLSSLEMGFTIRVVGARDFAGRQLACL